MHNSYTKREINMHSCTYATGVLISYHCTKRLEHDIVANVRKLRRARTTGESKTRFQ
jgi:hypothetical protein